MRTPFVLALLLSLPLAAKDFVPTGGESTRGLRFPTLAPDGKRVAFTYGGDIWVADVDSGTATRVTLHEAYETKPRWSPDGKTIAFISDRAGSYDVWTVSPDGGVPSRVTWHSATDVLSGWSPDGKWILFDSDRDGTTECWAVPSEGGTERRLTSHGGSFPVMTADGKTVVYCNGTSPRNIRDYKGSGNWDLYAIPFEGGVEKKLTTWEGNDLYPAIGADGTTVYYASERDGRFQIWKLPIGGGTPEVAVAIPDVDITNPCLGWDGETIAFENDYRVSTVLVDGTRMKTLAIAIKSDAKGYEIRKRTLTTGAKDPDLSRDGKWIAFSLGGDIWIMGAGGGKAKPLTSGPATDEWPRFSPDGTRIAYQSNASGNFDLYLIPSDGGDAVAITSHPKDDFYHSWAPDGSGLLFTSERSGNREIWFVPVEGGEPSQITRSPSNDDDAMFSPDGSLIAYDSDRGGNQDIWIMTAEGEIVRQVTFGSDIDQTPFWSPDGKMIAFEKLRGSEHILYVVSADGGDEMMISPDGEHPTWSSDGSRILFSTERGGARGIYQMAAPKEVIGGVQIPVMAETEVEKSREMRQTFEEAWKAIKDGFYDPALHGVNWDAVKTRYEGLVSTCETQEELYYFITQMLGELKASHVGISGEGSSRPCEETGLLGMTLLATADGTAGLSVTEVVKNGPADQAWIRVGDRVLAIDGNPVGGRESWTKYLSGTVGQAVKVRVAPGGNEQEARDVAVTAISRGQLAQVLYDNWLARRRALVEEKGGGDLAYIHLRGMDQQNLNHFLRELAGAAKDKKALVLDVRNNGGGNIHQALLDVLMRKPFGETRPRNGKNSPQPDATWAKPVVVLVNENSYSDAEVFAYAFQKTGLGPVIGVPTPGGVIGTVDITLSDGSTLRIPRVGWYGVDGKNMEGLGVQPDVVVEETPEDLAAGRDPQLESAIEVLLARLAGTDAAKADPPATGKGEGTEQKEEQAPEGPGK